ncbi:hypothetical protein GGI11_006440 [Coemansia sp. RSA 2049]|nr:hypothetical protein GGI11_006440 [Coemansia sp. RSA 2049]KAJ2517576.1 hypothetical protein H4217_003880 [Coemansia sp. RSA 1939]KAJ2610973.1 hypothetical protein EV177_003713 [Coemansia sp. RSA 1804]KAJ2682403.1 hypothetical protein GGH99_004754 [Coemansia sp. RSA 1285]
MPNTDRQLGDDRDGNADPGRQPETAGDEIDAIGGPEPNLPSESEEGPDDEDIFVPEASYAPLEDDIDYANDGDENDDDYGSNKSNKVQLSDAQAEMTEDQADAIDLDRILEDRINAEIAKRSSPEEKKRATTNTTFAGAGDAGGSSRHLDPRSLAPMEIDIGSSKDKAIMSAETAQTIKNIMAGIQLSDAAIPGWAKRVPEDAWMPRRKQQPPQQPPSLSSPCFADLTGPTAPSNTKDQPPS